MKRTKDADKKFEAMVQEILALQCDVALCAKMHKIYFAEGQLQRSINCLLTLGVANATLLKLLASKPVTDKKRSKKAMRRI